MIGATAEKLQTIGIVVTGILGALGLINSYLGRRTANAAFLLAQKQDRARQPDLAVYIADSLSWRNDISDQRLLGLQLTVANPSDTPGAVVGAELEVGYQLKATDRPTATVRVPCDSGERPNLPHLRKLDLPADLGPHGAAAGWLFFRIDDGLTGGQGIDWFRLLVRDSRGVEAQELVLGFREVVDEAQA